MLCLGFLFYTREQEATRKGEIDGNKNFTQAQKMQISALQEYS